MPSGHGWEQFFDRSSKTKSASVQSLTPELVKDLRMLPGRFRKWASTQEADFRTSVTSVGPHPMIRQSQRHACLTTAPKHHCDAATYIEMCRILAVKAGNANRGEHLHLVRKPEEIAECVRSAVLEQAPVLHSLRVCQTAVPHTTDARKGSLNVLHQSGSVPLRPGESA